MDSCVLFVAADDRALAAMVVAFAVDQRGDLGGDAAVAFGGGVLVDKCGAHGAVAHAVHEFTGAGSGGGGEVVTGVAQVVEVEPGR
ncbi:hypothetical protein Ae505Ps2_6252 [Pseudonocardia sp. Ae505_Ps2]|nr:hypothetical protein Ae505Ps2_6252 [Pseudonocardia sp. Ae505_Ps2]